MIKSRIVCFRCLFLVLSAVFLCMSCTSLRRAATIALAKTEGEVEIIDRRGKDVSPKENLRLFDGYSMGSHVASYAWMDLDQERLVKLDQESQIEIEKKRRELEIIVQSGSVFFNIARPLEEDESLNIRTSSMIVGIRGTCGWVEVLSDEGRMRVYLLEGRVECSADEEKKEVLAGEMAELTEDGQITVSKFTAEDIPDFVMEELQGEEGREKIEALAGNGEGPGNESGEESAEDLILNNGSTLVRYEGRDYYWRYTAESVENEGVFAAYSFRSEVENQMICREADGTEHVLFTAGGYGKIYLTKDRMYLYSDKGSYSVRPDGSDRIDDELLKWEGVDAGGRYIVGYSNQMLFSIDSQTGERRDITAPGELYNYCFVRIVDDYLYFSSMDMETGELVLYQYKMDGSVGVQEVARTELSEDEFFMLSSAIVTQLERLGDTLYYSYGFYAGTGGFFQTGGISYAVQDENRNTVEAGKIVDGISAEEFLVEESQGAVNIYFIQGETGSYIGLWENSLYSSCLVYNSATGAITPSDFRLSRPGAAVYMDRAVYREDEYQASYTLLIPEAMAAAYGCSEENPETAPLTTIIRDVEVIGNDVYYTVEKSSRAPQIDFGWRPGFVRNSSERYKMPIGGSEAELLFAY